MRALSPVRWFCCQLGAREHYAVARALAGHAALAALVTDAWVPPGHPLGWARRSLRERFHPELRGAPVHGATGRLLAFELSARLRDWRNWDLIMARNRWFQRHAVRSLKRIHAEIRKREAGNTSPRPSPRGGEGAGAAGEPPTIFAYSYAALDILRWAKQRGWRTVLGQIDAGPEMGRILAALEASGGTSPLTPSLSPSDGERVAGRRVRGGPPPHYWELWREECALADRIVVNSAWSRECLAAAGIPHEKVRVIPLAYEPAAASQALQRDFPARFDATRPLRLLFVGQVTYLKGIIPLLEAMRELADQPVELTILGSIGCDVSEPLRSVPSVRWAGAVPRGQVVGFYQAADALVFPSFCDGFGLVQLEAQAHGLPVIASRHCGAVVRDGVNGLLLPEVSGAAITSAVRRCLEEAGLLTRLAGNSRVEERFSLRSVGDQLLSVF